MNWEKGSSPMGLVIVIIMIAVSIIGLTYFLYEINDYYTPIVNGSVDPSGIGSSGFYNNTFNLTTTLIDVGGNMLWMILIFVFAILFLGIVYAVLKR